MARKSKFEKAADALAAEAAAEAEAKAAEEAAEAAAEAKAAEEAAEAAAAAEAEAKAAQEADPDRAIVLIGSILSKGKSFTKGMKMRVVDHPAGKAGLAELVKLGHAKYDEGD